MTTVPDILVHNSSKQEDTQVKRTGVCSHRTCNLVETNTIPKIYIPFPGTCKLILLGKTIFQM